ncbi:MAG TPA: protein kinase, partial [Polyangiaceae bacterium]
MALASREPFASRRFQLVRHLGAGGMGTVFEAIDRETGGRVALKTVRAANPLALLYLKNEFRALQDVRHENLVELRDLVEEDGRFLVSMELVQGVDFLTYVRGAESWSALSGVSETRRIPSAADGASLSARSEAPRLAAGSFDEARLRNAFAQLAAGLSALHASGKLHRDVKPSNILVTREGRVVLVDFGLATDLHAVGSGGEARGIGTQAFSAPEQYAGQTLSAAADWFSAGVVLYVALSGVLPFHGEIARRRARGSFEPIERLCPDAPDDLRRLCTDLLEPEPERRPSARDVLGRLGRAEGYAEAAGGGAVFVGRERELSALERALSDSRVHAVTTFVVGDSGVGKSTLVQRAIERVSEPTLLVLRGRCYERELVPYKALDGIVDELSHFLARLDEPTLLRLLPDSAGVLARLFPVLERVPAFARLPSELLGDPLELRAHAFATLRQLIYAIAERQPTLLYIDDLQWADADSYLLLSDLLREPRSPKICLIATARPSGVAVPERAALLAQTLADVRRIELSALGPADARSLAQTLVAGQNAELAQAIADEAAGHPLFVVTLAEHASRAGTFSAGQLKLDDALWARVERVDGAARRILELLSTAGAPLEPAFLRAAAAAEPEAYAQSSSALRAARLVRSSGDERTATRIEPYHDRVRETVLGRLDDDARRSCHRRLAETLEASGRAALDPEALVRHLEGAGFAQRAATQAERAAERASTALAFEQAAELYQVALRLGSFEASALHRLHVQLAQALTNAGRAAEAAAAYLRCAEHAVGAERLLYRRLAADHMLRSGHLEQGLEILSDVLQGLGERLPSPRQAVLRTLA